MSPMLNEVLEDKNGISYQHSAVLPNPGLEKRMGRVLLIEDDVDLNLSLATRLRKAGFEVLSAFDGVKGLEKGTIEEPDLILLDLRLPRMHGLKVLHRLKMIPLTHETPIVIMTGDPNPRIDEIADNWGIKGVFHKPCPQRELVSAIQKIIEGADHD